MLELQWSIAAVIGCYARSDALDALGALMEAIAIRVAADELLLLCAPDRARAVQQAAAGQLATADGDGLVLNVSGGSAVWTIRGDERDEAYARLCAAPLPSPPAVVQALFAHVPAKVVVTTSGLHVLVSSVVAHHVRMRILEACSSLQPAELAAAPLPVAVAEPIA